MLSLASKLGTYIPYLLSVLFFQKKREERKKQGRKKKVPKHKHLHV
jgi:hypothetical protein